MRRVHRRLIRYAALGAAFAACAWTSVGSAFADVFGHLRLTVKAGQDGAGIPNAKITLHDTMNVRPDISLETDADGQVLSPPLENRDWEVKVEAGGTVLVSQVVTVVAETVTDLDVVANTQPAVAGAKPNATVNLIRKAQSVIAALRTKRFNDLFPLTMGSNFSLENVLRTVPGFTSGAAGQIFSRGDQALGAILVNGIRMPEGFFGQLGNDVAGNLIANVEAMTGGLPAEYAGLASSVINMNLRGGTLQPKNGISLLGGTFATFDGSVVLSGQTGHQMGEPDANGRVARNLGYFINLTDRRTDNSIQSPQPNEQEANNNGRYNSFFGNFDWRPNEKDQWNFLVNHTPRKFDVPNRTGLGESWPSGGYGFGGYFDNRTRGNGGLQSQEELGIDESQEAVTSFGLMTWRRRQDANTDWVFSFGASHVGNDLNNDSPAIEGYEDGNPTRPASRSARLRSTFGRGVNDDGWVSTLGGSGINLPFNSSQEFNPTISRNNHSWQAQGAFHRKSGGHDFKVGFFLDESKARESYHMVPGSILALDALIASDPKLAPGANPVIIGEDEFGNPIQAIDPLGNPMYSPTGEPVPTVRANMKRQNRSFFVQDDWKASGRFTVNYGARWDSFLGEQNLGMEDADKDMLSPRVNMAYQYDHRTVIRASFNRLFQAPPLVQGVMVGANPKVARSDQYDLSFERSLGPTSAMKISAYHKKTKDQVYVKQLVEGLQNGPLSAVNFDNSDSRGIEISAQMQPIDGKGFSGFLTWTNALTKPHGMGSDGNPAPDFLPTDQRNTITAGMNYMFANGANWALSWDFGSGLPSADVFDNGDRRQQSRMNFRFQSSQTTFGPFGGFQVDVENLLNSKTVIGFNSPVNGTRFQQARRITISAFSEFLSR